ncbi:hypothetical protein B0H21DRAFT_706068 [Amylocystis lapponica]|nr:hypothetical protein B0H21DRAFT_706068 [Amylocystis lapponica]
MPEDSPVYTLRSKLLVQLWDNSMLTSRAPFSCAVINAKTRSDTTQLSQKAPNLYVKIRFPDSGFDQKTQKTDVIKKTYNPVWNKEFLIKGVKYTSSQIQFDLKHDPSFLPFQTLCFGTGKISIDQLITQSKNILCKLDLQIVMDDIQGDLCSAQVTDTSSHLALGFSMIQGASDLVESQIPLAKAIEALLFKLTRLKIIGDEIAKIHPYVNAAWQIVSAVHKIVKAQYDRDQEILELVAAMTDAISFIEDAQVIDQSYNQQQYLHKILSQIMPQIWECALFVKEYVADGFLEISNTFIREAQTSNIL